VTLFTALARTLQVTKNPLDHLGLLDAGDDLHCTTTALAGVYVYRDNRPPRFQRIEAPDKAELEELVQLISQRVGRCLERQGLLEQDTESAWLNLYPAEDTDATPIKRGGPGPRFWAVPSRTA
jgi:hypothetical protein